MKKDLQKLLHLKHKISSLSREDNRDLALLGKEVFYVITRNLHNFTPSGDYKEEPVLSDLIDWLQCLQQMNRTKAGQLKSDILFSIELSLHALSNSKRN